MKKLLLLFLALLITFSLSSCTDIGGVDLFSSTLNDSSFSAPPVSSSPVKLTPVFREKEETWVVYWYLCGSDLESECGFSTLDLQEMLEVTLPKSVKVVIQTGGACEWQNNVVDSSLLQRFVYEGDELFLVDEQPLASMGDADTLADFLSFAKENYPADKTAVVFWNHGGGSVSGAAFDEIYDNDSLTLDEMYDAFSAVWTPNAAAPPLELIGFDTCLMATIDVANVFDDFAHYLVGSEETEPGNGWYYSGWLGALAENPSMDGAQLGVAICDTYYQGCVIEGTEDNATLSLTDLTKIQPLLTSYEDFGREILQLACEDPGFVSAFARAAAKSENYGGNTREQGYTNMVDLGHLARQTADDLSSAQVVLNALDNCVLYKISGPYRAEATGLSCYYSYNSDKEDFDSFCRIAASTAFQHFFSYGLTGTLNDDGMSYIADMDIWEIPAIATVFDMGWDGMTLDLDENNISVLELGPAASDILASIAYSLSYVDEEYELDMLLGIDNDIVADWGNGIFRDNFRGVWGSIDGCLVYMELSFESEDYNLYSVPVLLNGEDYNLQVVYDFTEQEWYILGARQGIDESGMADKELRLLNEGDQLTVIWYIATDEDDAYQPYNVNIIEVTEDTAFAEMELPDGFYVMIYEMQDVMGNIAYSDSVIFECRDGDIYTTV